MLDNAIPLAETPDKQIITIDEANKIYNPSHDYGSKMLLTCPECNGLVELCRKHDNNNVNRSKMKYWYFRHKKYANNKCPGYGEKSSHKLAEQILKNIIGKK